MKVKMKFFNIFIVFRVFLITSSQCDTQTLEPFTSMSEIISPTPVPNTKKENVEYNTSGLNQMFWVFRNTSSQSSIQETGDKGESMGKTENTTAYATEVNEIEKQDVFSDPVWGGENVMNEQIFLTRNNCDIELHINEWEEKKLKIEYDNLGIKKSGQCHTTVYGKGGIFLALLVTGIHINGHGRNHSGEILRIVSRNNNFNFTLIEYRGNEQYYPVVLSDSDRVFIILYFNGTSSTKSRSGFNLEVFNYYKNPIITVQHKKPYGHSGKDINNIYLTTTAP